MRKINLIRKYYIFFIFYSMIGWIYEEVLEVFIYQTGFTNRGFLFGPYLPVYGVGAIVFILSLRKLKEKKIKVWKINVTPLLVFVGIVFIATFLELITSYGLEIINGKWLWNYDHYFMDFQGRIALNPSIRFGIGGMVFMYILQPLFEKIVNKLSPKVFNILFWILFVVFVVDLLFKIIK